VKSIPDEKKADNFTSDFTENYRQNVEKVIPWEKAD
jgi:hypothetical protein